MEEDLHTKQQFLRREIIDEGYDPSDFNIYMCSIRQEENVDLDSWSLEQIKEVVISYKEAIKNKKIQEEEAEQLQENQENQETKQEEEDIFQNNQLNINNINNNIENNNNENNIPTISNEPRNTIQALEAQLNKQDNDPFEDYQKIAKCEKLEKNELTYREDLFITISEPVKINPGFFSSSYFQYAVKTYPLNYSVSRKLSDFSFLNQKLPLINPVKYIPALPNFTYGLKDDSKKKMLYLQNYMNLLIENRYFRSLPLVYDFLTLPQNDWNKKVKEKYSKIKEATGFDLMPNFEGKYIIRITKKDELKAKNIKNEINLRNEGLVNLNSQLDELLSSMDKVGICFKNVGLAFEDLEKKNKNNKVLNKGFENLSKLFKTWSNDYIAQKDFIRDEIKYFFKFINKEYNTFLKNFENYRLARDNYKKTFDKMKKKTPTKEEISVLKDSKNYYAFELIHINDEYSQLEERLGKRLKKQFVRYYENKDIIFQDIQKCCELCKFHVTLNEKIDKLENTVNQYEEDIKNSQNQNNIKEENEISNETEHNINEINNNNIVSNEENMKDNNNYKEEIETKKGDNEEKLKNNMTNEENKNENLISNNDIKDKKIKEEENKNELDIKENSRLEQNEENSKEVLIRDKIKEETKREIIKDEIKDETKDEIKGENKEEKEEEKVENKNKTEEEKKEEDKIKEEVKEINKEEKKEENEKEKVKEEKKIEIIEEKKEEINIEKNDINDKAKKEEKEIDENIEKNKIKKDNEDLIIEEK